MTPIRTKQPLLGTICLIFCFTVGLDGLCLAAGEGRPVQSILSQKSGTASWYSTEACRVNPDPRCPMANGRSLYEQEKTQPFFAASWDYPFGTRLLVESSLRRITVVVTDRGPAKWLYRQGRIIDLSQAAFQALAPLKEGIIQVSVESP